MISEAVLSARRAEMVKVQIAQRGITCPGLLKALQSIPRHRFVPERLLDQAYQDCALPIGRGQTISQPYMVAVMTACLELTGSERILEIGCGSGYQAAVLGQVAREVHTLELIPSLAASAAGILADLGIQNVHIHSGDGSLGWPQAAPYDGILVSAAAPAAPATLLEQLIPGGRLVLPVGGINLQNLQVWRRTPHGFESQTLFSVSFVPLRGIAGWSSQDWPTTPDNL